ncbi:MAG: SixA phosphatase family protein [Stackebrandtia sp.]
MARTLILMRHGKSAYPPGIADRDRPLSARGRREAALAGTWLRETQPMIEAVSCSDAVRTRETLAATGITAPVAFDSAIYEASPHTLIELVQLTDAAVQALLVVGHSPGMPWTAWELAANRASLPAEELSHNFPTSALAVLEFDRPWADVEPGTGDLVRFHVPR